MQLSFQLLRHLEPIKQVIAS